MPKVSIIVAIYKVEEYIRKCLETLQSQTLKDIEIIMVIGISNDKSESISREFLSDERFKIVCTEPKGLSDARNVGMKYAKGKYLGFIDGDDYVEPTMYEELYKKALENDSDIVECDFIWEYPNKNIIDETKVDYNNPLKNIRVEAWNKLYKREFIEKHELNFTYALRYEDVNWTYKIIPFAKNFTSVTIPLYHYIQRGNSLSNTQNEKVRDIFLILMDIINYYQKEDILDKYHNEIEYLFIRILLGSSFKRTSKVKDMDLRCQILNEAWDLLNREFPNWKENIYLKEKGMKNRYYLMINKKTYMLLGKTIGGRL